MKEDKLVISEERPLAIRRILDILNSGPKLSILKVLLEEGEVTAKDIADRIKIKLPTVLSHLSDLVKAGLVRVNIASTGSKQVKKYSLVSRKIVLNIDLELLLHLEKYAKKKGIY